MEGIEEIISRIKKGEDINSILREYRWQTFENLVAYIFEQHGFTAKIHYRFKTKRKYEIDVLATKGGRCILVECKKWRGKTASASKILKAVEKQMERAKEFRKSTGNDCEAIIVTLLDQPEEIEGIKLVPISRLNGFLLDYF